MMMENGGSIELKSKPGGCSNGACLNGGCNRLNTFDWLSKLDIKDSEEFGFVEVSFKNGARKDFFWTQTHVKVITGDMVVVETGNGYDIGVITLSGELVRLQMLKKKVEINTIELKILRKASERDLEKLDEVRKMEVPSMIKARSIARTLGLEMKVGDVEYQADKRKATFYYTADGRVDFRELVRHYAREFRVKIEMRQIGARQESSRIGGVGSCGRELCCSTWLTDYKSVSTNAARYQNLSINQSKLSGQCGRLKCCLNYELDIYLDALSNFPDNVDELRTKKGVAVQVKIDIFRNVMYFAYQIERGRSNIIPLTVNRVREIKELNDKGIVPDKLVDSESAILEQKEEIGIIDIIEEIELPKEANEKRRSRKSRRKKRPPRKNNPNTPNK